MKVGFIGLGDMGLPMARRLLSSGFEVVAWNRSAGKLDTLCAEGAERATSPADVMDGADVIGLCLSSHETVEAVSWGERGLFHRPPATHKTVADFSTGSPVAAARFAERARAQDTDWVDIPISGGVPGATQGRLVAFAGGTAGALATLKPMLDALCQRVSHMGGSGSGQIAKLCSQTIVATNLAVMAECFAMARQSGIDVRTLPEAFKGGFADSLPLQIFGPRMANHQYSPRLGALELMRKDVLLALDLAATRDRTMPILGAVARVYGAAYADPRIGGDADVSRIIEVFEPPRE